MYIKWVIYLHLIAILHVIITLKNGLNIYYADDYILSLYIDYDNTKKAYAYKYTLEEYGFNIYLDEKLLKEFKNDDISIGTCK